MSRYIDSSLTLIVETLIKVTRAAKVNSLVLTTRYNTKL